MSGTTAKEHLNTLKPGDVVRYQTQGMPEERTGTVASVSELAVKLEDGEKVPKTAFLEIVDTQRCRDAHNALKKAAEKELRWIGIEDLTWHRKKVQQSNGVIQHCGANFPAGKDLQKGQYVYVAGDRDAINIYDPIQDRYLTRESPAARRARGEKTHTWNKKRSSDAQAGGEKQVKDEDPGEYRTSTDDTSGMPRIDAQEALNLAESLKEYLNGLITQIQNGQTAVQELMNVAQATNIGKQNNEDSRST